MPRIYKPKKGATPRVLPDAETVAAAVAEVKNGASYKGTAKKYDINVMTLKRVIRRGDDHLPGFQKSLIFTSAEEKQLTDYLLHASRLNYGLPILKLRQLAYEFAVANSKKVPSSWDEKKMAGRDWSRNFMSRNAELSLRRPEPTSLARSTAFNRHTVDTFFEKLRTTIQKNQFTPEKIWNVDETGVTTVHKPSKIIGQKGVKQVSKVTSGERGQLVTVCSGVNACGNHIPPFLIFPRINWQDRMVLGAPPGSAGACHPSGWMTKENFLKYLEHFKKYSNCSPDNKHLIILDNHDSHVNLEVINFARNNGLVLLTLPPHTSHKLQPLDRAVFGPLKTYYNAAASDWMTNNAGKNLGIYEIPGLLGQSYPKAFSPANILSGFRVSGIYPLNSNIFREDEFYSSLVTDRPDPTGESDRCEQTPISQPAGPSGSSLQSKVINLASTAKTPEEVRPFPKAPPRSENSLSKGRKRGRCRVITETPEKQELEAEREEREKKASSVKRSFVDRAEKIEVNKSKKKRKEKKTESDSSEYEESWKDSGDSLDDIDLLAEESDGSSISEDGFFEVCCPKIKDFVLVEFQRKKGKLYFVGEVTENDILSTEILVNFLRKQKKHFYFPTIKDEGLVSRESVRKVLPKPEIRRGYFNFKIRFPNNITIG